MQKVTDFKFIQIEHECKWAESLYDNAAVFNNHDVCVLGF